MNPVAPINPADFTSTDQAVLQEAGRRLAILKLAIVELWVAAPTDKKPITELTGNDKAAFEGEADIGPHTETAIRQFKRSRGLNDDGVIDEKTAHALNDAFNAVAAEGRRILMGSVRGSIADVNGRPLLEGQVTNLWVVAKHKPLTSGAEFRGEAKVQADFRRAWFEVTYYQPANLQLSLIRRVGVAGDEVIDIENIDVVVQAPLVLEKNIKITTDDAALVRPDEFTVLSSMLGTDAKPLLVDNAGVPLTAVPDSRQIETVATNTRTPLELVEPWMVAQRFANRTLMSADNTSLIVGANLRDVAGSFFYALIKEDTLIRLALDRVAPPFIWTEINLATDLEPVLNEIPDIASEELLEAVQKAVSGGYVDQDEVLEEVFDQGGTPVGVKLKTDIENALAAWNADGFTEPRWAARVPDAFAAMVGELVEKAPKQKKVLNSLSIKSSSVLAQLEKMADAPKTVLLPEAKVELPIVKRLKELCGGNEEMAFSLREAYKKEITKESEVDEVLAVKRPRETAARLVALSWIGKAREGEAKAMARQVAQRLEEEHFEVAYATQRERHLCEQAAASSPGAMPAPDASVDFMRAHPEVSFRQSSRKNKSIPLWATGATAWDGVPEETRMIHRLCKLTHRHDHIEALLSAGIRSSYDIRARGRNSFLSLMEGKIPRKEGKLIFGRAAAITDHAQRTYAEITLLRHDARVAALAAPQQTKPDGSKVRKAWQDSAADFPNWEQLFGSLDSCQCNWCDSIYGPGAYLADLMYFLSKRFLKHPAPPPPPAAITATATTAVATIAAAPVAATSTAGATATAIAAPPAGICTCERPGTALEALLCRRPDLKYIDLNCPNAETRMPYIDLVCEILEEEVAKESVMTIDVVIHANRPPDSDIVRKLASKGFHLTGKARFGTGTQDGSFILRDEAASFLFEMINPAGRCSKYPEWVVRQLRQTYEPSNELLAAPQYSNACAYQELADPTTHYHLCLPFDLHFEESSSYFAKLGVRRADLMRRLQKAPDAIDKHLTAEMLGLSEAEALTIVTPNLHQGDYWAQPSTADAVKKMASVKNLIKQTRVNREEVLTHADVHEIMRGGLFIVTATLGPVRVVQDPDSCAESLEPLDPQALDRLNRLLRLHRKVQWPFHTLCRALSCAKLAPNANNLDETFLCNIARMSRMAEDLQMDVLNLLKLWLPLEYDEKHASSSDYRSLFLNKSVLDTIEDAFLIKNIRDNETAPDSAAVWARDHKEYIALALDAEPVVVGAVIERLKPAGGNLRLTMGNLSQIRAWLILARTVGLNVEDCLLLASLVPAAGGVDFDPFESTETLVRFYRATSLLNGWGVAVQDVNFWLKHTITPPPQCVTQAQKDQFVKDELTKRLLPADVIKEALDTIKAEFQKSAEQVAPVLTKMEELEARDSAEPSRDPGDVPDLPKPEADDWIGLVKLAAQLTGMKDDDAGNIALYLQDPAAVPAGTDAFPVLLGRVLQGYDELADMLANPLVVTLAKPWTDDHVDLVLQMVSSIISTVERRLREDAVITTLAEVLQASRETTEALLRGLSLNVAAAHAPADSKVLLKILTDDRAAGDADAIQYAYKVASLAAALSLETEEVKWSLAATADEPWLSLAAIPQDATAAAVPDLFVKWEGLLDGLRVVRSFPAVQRRNSKTRITMTGLLTPYALTPAGDAAVIRSERRGQWLLLSRMSGVLYDELVEFFGFANEEFWHPATYEAVLHLAKVLKDASLSIGDAKELAEKAVDETGVAILRKMLKKRSGEAMWLEVLKEIQDPIRKKRRDALVNYLLTRPDHPPGCCRNCGCPPPPPVRFNNVAHINRHFLLDVRNEPIVQRSRIVMAHSTLQRFIRRCKAGVERNAPINPDDNEWDETDWILNLRRWEANRKTFAYPENWLDPDVRDDRSEFFKDLEQTLQQDEVKDAKVAEALLAYLAKLDDTAMLEVMAAFYEERGSQRPLYAEPLKKETALAVFARTKTGDPATYYHRSFEEENEWTPWKKVELEIVTDHLLAFVRNGRLYLAWPMFVDYAKEEAPKGTPSASDANYTPQAERRWRIQLAVSEFSGGKWQPKRVSQSFLEERNDFVKRTAEQSAQIRKACRFYTCDNDMADWDDPAAGYFVVCYRNDTLSSSETADKPQLKLLGAFNLTGNKGFPETVSDEVLKAIPLVRALSKDVETNSLRVLAPVVVDATFEGQRWNEMPKRPVGAGGTKRENLALRGVSGLRSKELSVLEKTPGLFRVTAPSQTSALDRFIIDMMTFLNGGGDVQENVLWRPSGVLMPFFYEDGRRSYAMVPELPEWDDKEGRGTVSKVVRLLKKVVETTDHDQNKENRSLLVDLSDAIERVKTEGNKPQYIARKIEQWRRDYASQLERFEDLLQQEVKIRPLPFYHPYVTHMQRALQRGGFEELMLLPIVLDSSRPPLFRNAYAPNAVTIQDEDGANDTFDFSATGAYAGYNWEVFFHLPYLIAGQLSNNGEFRQAERWWQYIFDPRSLDPRNVLPRYSSLHLQQNGATKGRYWITKPFRERPDSNETESYAEQELSAIMRRISRENLREDEKAIKDWRRDPFRPYVVARGRTVAFQKATLMRYLDNLIAWGDSLFRQDTIESIEEASQRYDFAAELLGERPVNVPKQQKMDSRCYAELAARVDEFGNALVQMEHLMPEPDDVDGECQCNPMQPLPMGTGLYFCIPQNDKLMAYWDTIDDRLYKIHNSLNIDGVERQLALFAPPIDPGMLARAVNAGVSIGNLSALSAQPAPLYRFTTLLEKARAAVRDAAEFESAFNSALKERDGGALLNMRERQQVELFDKIIKQKDLQIAEAETNLQAVLASRAVIQKRIDHYEKLINEGISDLEAAAQGLHGAGIVSEVVATVLNMTGGVTSLIPDFIVGASGFGGSPHVTLSVGGSKFAQSAINWAAFASGLGGIFHSSANLIGTQAGYVRREQDWDITHKLAVLDRDQKDVEVKASRIRIEHANGEKKLSELQKAHAERITEFLKDRQFATQEHLDWLVGDLSATYFQSYKLAQSAVLTAARALQFELPEVVSDASIPEQWDPAHKGLRCAQKLISRLQSLDQLYLSRNQRCHEITKHISLVRLDPLAFLKLKNDKKGVCEFDLPEWLFDMDNPGHYLRRIKTVLISFPGATGPYASVNGKLSLVESRIRLKPNRRAAATDGTWLVNCSRPDSLVTSSGMNDSGMFESRLNDERLLLFEGAGAVSRWRLSLPEWNNREFDRRSLSDVKLEVKYSAKSGSPEDERSAIRDTETILSEGYSANGNAARSVVQRLISIADEFPTEWIKFGVKDADGLNTLVLPKLKEHLPYSWPKPKRPVYNVYLIAPVSSPLDPAATLGGKGCEASQTEVLSQLRWSNVTWNGEPLELKMDLASPAPILLMLEQAITP